MAIISILIYALLMIIGYELGIYNKTVGLWQLVSSSLLIFKGGAVKLKGLGINNPTWYLSVLIICYIIYKIILIITQQKNTNPVWLYIGMIGIGIGIIDYKLNLPFLNPDVARGYMSFFLGAVLFKINSSYNHICQRIKILTIPIIGYIIYGWIYLDKFIDNQRYIFVFLVFPIIILSVINSSIIDRILDHKFVGHLGAISYEIYLWHCPLLMLSKIICHELSYAFKCTWQTMVLFTIFVVFWSFGANIVERLLNNRMTNLSNV